MTHDELVAKMSNDLDALVVSPVSLLPFEQLALGWNDVEVKMVVVTNDFMTGLRNPVMKSADKLPVWKDPTRQIAFYFENEHRQGITRRNPLDGFWKFADLLKADADYAAECFEAGDQKYAVDKKDNVRLINKENSEKARFILMRCLNACGISEGSVSDAIKQVVGKKLMIEVTAHEFNHKTYYDVSNYAKTGTPLEDLKRIPKPKNVLDEIPATLPI